MSLGFLQNCSYKKKWNSNLNFVTKFENMPKVNRAKTLKIAKKSTWLDFEYFDKLRSFSKLLNFQNLRKNWLDSILDFSPKFENVLMSNIKLAQISKLVKTLI